MRRPAWPCARRASASTPPSRCTSWVFSNGGALAMKYALDALDVEGLARPDRLILISPMIGITSFARFAGLAALPALLPAFAKTRPKARLLPEFNPFRAIPFRSTAPASRIPAHHSASGQHREGEPRQPHYSAAADSLPSSPSSISR